MQYFNNILCLTHDELVPSIVSRDTYNKLRQRDNITVHGIGGNGRIVLIEFETLPPKYKLLVRKVYGDPYVYVAKQPILNSLEFDHKAQQFYMDYELPNGDRLPATDKDINGKEQINYVNRYTLSATWLNMLDRLMADKRALKRELNISITDFWDTASEMIKIKKIDLPAHPRRLKAKLKEYTSQPDQEAKYEFLIEKHKFGNTSASKVNDEVAEALLMKMLSFRNLHDDTVIAEKYNLWAIETERQTITASTVGYRRKMWHNQLMFEREGSGKTYNQLSKRAKRKRSEAPLGLINSDDNVLDVYFNAPGNKWFRPVLYVVIDAFNDYILGYAVGQTVTKELIKAAYADAQRNVMRLTGGAYLWHQIQTDHWGISSKSVTEMEEFYSSQAIFTPAMLKNAQTKYIERSFGTTWHQQLKLTFPDNYSGVNITSKEKLNPDTLVAKNFPSVTDAKEKIQEFICAMRNTKREKDGLTREQEWLEAFNASEKSKKRAISEETRLLLFGEKNARTNKLTAAGVNVTLLGQKMTYEISQADIYEHNGKSVQVIYDKYDLSKVLITDNKGLRIVANEYELLPAAIADYKPGDRERINNLLDEKKTLFPMIQNDLLEREANLSRVKIDAESRMMANVLIKEQAHNDQKLINVVINGGEPDMIDEDNTDIYSLM